MCCSFSVSSVGSVASYFLLFKKSSNYLVYEDIDNVGFDIAGDNKEVDTTDDDELKDLQKDCDDDDDCTHFVIHPNHYYPKTGKKLNIEKKDGVKLYVKKSNKTMIKKLKKANYDPE